MKRFLSASLLACMTLGLTGTLAGCHASASVDPPKDSTSDSSYKKTTIRDANGNVTEMKVEKKSN